ncbi:hypothetical protein Tco_0961865 [Tanacetum coccineum]
MVAVSVGEGGEGDGTTEMEVLAGTVVDNSGGVGGGFWVPEPLGRKRRRGLEMGESDCSWCRLWWGAPVVMACGECVDRGGFGGLVGGGRRLEWWWWRGGAWYWGSGRSGDEERFWTRPENSPWKFIRGREVRRAAVVAAGNLREKE